MSSNTSPHDVPSKKRSSHSKKVKQSSAESEGEELKEIVTKSSPEPSGDKVDSLPQPKKVEGETPASVTDNSTDVSDSDSATVLSKKLPQRKTLTTGEREESYKKAVEMESIEPHVIAFLAFQGVPDKPRLRSLYWKVLLGYLPTEHNKWEQTLAEQRKRYADLKKLMTSLDQPRPQPKEKPSSLMDKIMAKIEEEEQEERKAREEGKGAAKADEKEPEGGETEKKDFADSENAEERTEEKSRRKRSRKKRNRKKRKVMRILPRRVRKKMLQKCMLLLLLLLILQTTRRKVVIWFHRHRSVMYQRNRHGVITTKMMKALM